MLLRVIALAKLLHSLIAELKPEIRRPRAVMIELEASGRELEQMASALFASDFASVSGDKAPFIWPHLPFTGRKWPA